MDTREQGSLTEEQGAIADCATALETLNAEPKTNNETRNNESMSNLKEPGIWPCAVLGATFGEDDKGSPQVQINVRIVDGPDTGKCCTYEDQVNARSALYIGRSCKAVGWKGRDLKTLKDDCAAWIESTGGKSTVEIKHLAITKGKRAGETWDKVNSIGRGPRVLAAPSASTIDDANEAMRMAMEADGGGRDDEEMPF